MKKAWADLFAAKPKKKLIEDKPYRCVICKSNKNRLKTANTYAWHMKSIHKFHKGFDLAFPKPSARDGYSLPKIEKHSKVKKIQKFKSQEDALKHVRAKGKGKGSRNKIKREDYLPMIKSYEKAKKEKRIKE